MCGWKWGSTNAVDGAEVQACLAPRQSRCGAGASEAKTRGCNSGRAARCFRLDASGDTSELRFGAERVLATRMGSRGDRDLGGSGGRWERLP